MSIRTLSGTVEDASASVCVIGAGMAGIVIAQRLVRAGLSVVVLESGGSSFDPTLDELNRIDDVFGTHDSAVTGRFRALGGSSIRWGGRLIPITGDEAGPRPYIGVPGWPFDTRELDRYRPEIEQLFGVDDSSYEEDVLEQLDRSRLIPRNDLDFAARFPKWAPFRRCDLGAHTRQEFEKAPNVVVWLEASVCGFEIDTESGRVKTALARSRAGSTLKVGAHEFVVAAGAIETTRLLLLLDRHCGDRIFTSCDAVGRYLQEHLGAKVADLIPLERQRTNRFFGYRFIGSTRRSLHLQLTQSAQKADAVASAFAHATMVAEPTSTTDILRRALRGLQAGRFDVTPREALDVITDTGSLFRGVVWRYIRRQHYWPPDLGHQVNVWIEQLPSAANRIFLSDRRDRFGVPLARVEWRPTEADERTFRACTSRLAAYWRRRQLGRFCELSWTLSPDDASVHFTREAAHLFHPSGSTRMGTSPRESVVGPDLRSHHLANLTVASASVFPTAGSTNPTLTLLQIAMRAADSVARQVGART